MAAARRDQRRRLTNYTSTYTPPASLVAQAAQTRAAQAAVLAGGPPPPVGVGMTSCSSRRKCSSLDRSEGEGDERQRRLKGSTTTAVDGRSASFARSSSGGGVMASGEGGPRRTSQSQRKASSSSSGSGGLTNVVEQKQRHSYHEQHLLAAQQAKVAHLAAHKQQQQQQATVGMQQRHSMHEQQSFAARSPSSSTQQKQAAGGSRSSPPTTGVTSERSAGSNQATSGSPRPRKEKISSSPRNNNVEYTRRTSSEYQGEKSSSRPSSSSRRSSSKNESTANRSSEQQQRKSKEMSEQQRIEEYAGKRALLRLEQELTDHSESQLSHESIKSVMDRKKLARVPQVSKSDLIIGQYLGRGNFCDVFEVTWILPEQRNGGGAYGGGGGGWSGNSNRSMVTYDDSSDDGGGLGESMESLALSCSNDLSLIRNNEGGMGGADRRGSRRSVSQITTSFGGGAGGRGDLRGSMAAAANLRNSLRNPNTMALKCLRPAVRAQPRKFVIGAEDLAHETALLACLDHPNIIQLYGRAEGCFSNAFTMRSKNSKNQQEGSSSGGGEKTKGKQMSNEGYFIILDRLMTTLTDRIEEWKDECRAINGVIPPDGSPVQLPPESTLREHLCKRLKVAYCIADAKEYLHSRHVVFRDLKPANVGFDCNDCVKMFDFGFATSIAPLLSQPYEGYGPLTETCGTRRYMAPEVALKLGYGKEVDVYSFGMLLWEICALDKPFDSIQSVDEFHDLVVLCGKRPSLNIDPLWTVSLKNLMSRCWSTDPLDRPTMAQVKSMLCNVLRDINKAMDDSRSGASGATRGRGGGTQQQRQEQGGNFVHKWRRRISI